MHKQERDMIERVRITKPKRQRDEPNRMLFTDLGIKRLKPPKEGQELYWDKGQKGLALLVGSGGAKTFRSTFKLNGTWITRTLGRFGEVIEDSEEDANIAWAREQTRKDRIAAGKGKDPRVSTKQSNSKLTYGTVVDQFIEEYAKPRQRTWDQTERVLKNVEAWLDKPIAEITKHDAYALLKGFRSDGYVYKAAITLRWLKTMWKWAWKRDLVEQPIMEAVDFEYEKRERTRVYSDNEIKAIWAAANQLEPAAGAYVKLLILLAPRKTSLACMQRSHLDDANNPTLWTTPFELTKSKKNPTQKRKYLTPLPSLAQGIIKGLVRNTNDHLFPALTVRHSKADRVIFDGQRVRRELIKLGAPKDFGFHTMRHTLATWLQNKGHSEWEVGLVLNHSGSGSVTGNYSHGYPLDLKTKLLTEWADHIANLVQAEGGPRANVVVFGKRKRARG
jgi:integrase